MSVTASYTGVIWPYAVCLAAIRGTLAVSIQSLKKGRQRFMDNQRLILVFALAAVLFLIYESWMQDYASPGQPQVAQEQSVEPQTVPTPSSNEIPKVAISPGAVPQDLSPTDVVDSTPITVETDLLRLEISPRGGTISSAWLMDYPIVPERPEDKLRLMKPVPPNMFVAQSGLLGKLLPTHEGLFSSAATRYTLAPGTDQLQVVLQWRSDSGTEVEKIYTFSRGSYVIDVKQTIKNATGAPLAAQEYNQFQRTDLQDPHETRFVKTFTGGVYYSPEEKYKKVPFPKMKEGKLDKTVVNGWISMMQHYFMAAWIPPSGEQETFYTNVLNGSRYIIGKYSPAVSIPAGASHTFENRLFIGPKLQDILADIAPGLDLVVDYGWLTVIAKPIFWLLGAIHSLVGNWGWSIIFLTILIKLAFYKLSETSYKSMANMRQLTPRLQALKDRYGDDKQRLNQAMMELYKTEKINPLGGCLPILIQIPVFIALYWVLLESVEMRRRALHASG